jgi:hypothetical protein
MLSATPRSNAVLLRGLLAAGASSLALFGASAGGAAASASEAQASAARPAAVATVTAAKTSKPCRKVRVKKRTKTGRVVRRHGKPVFVTRRKCKKPKPVPLPTLPAPVGSPAPVPAPVPGPSPAPATPKIDPILGWSTVAADPDTPPAGLVPDGGTITNCPNIGSLSVYLRRSGFTEVGLVSYVWKRDGEVVASGANSSTTDGNFRHGIIGSPLPNGVYEITWTYGGATIGKATVTRDC